MDVAVSVEINVIGKADSSYTNPSFLPPKLKPIKSILKPASKASVTAKSVYKPKLMALN